MKLNTAAARWIITEAPSSSLDNQSIERRGRNVAHQPNDSADDPCAIYDRHTIDALQSGAIENLSGSQIDYLSAMIKTGVRRHIDNVPADVDYRLIVYKGCALPFSISSKQETVFPVSPKTCWFDYARLLYEKSFKREPAPVSNFFLATLSKFVRFERLIVLNNWWLTNNPTPSITPEQIDAFVSYLTDAYPDYLIIIKSIPETDPTSIIPTLQCNGFDLIKFRHMHFWTRPAPKQSRGTKQFRSDQNLLKKTELSKYYAGHLTERQSEECEALYQALYIEKHTSMNTQLNRRWFSLACNSGFVDVFVLDDKSATKGFIVSYDDPIGINVGTCGYDQQTPRSAGLYRMLVASTLCKGGIEGKTVNLSTSVPRFKELRGCRRVIEFEGVYTRHLCLGVRLLMKLFIWCYNTLLSKMRCA